MESRIQDSLGFSYMGRMDHGWFVREELDQERERNIFNHKILILDLETNYNGDQSFLFENSVKLLFFINKHLTS